MRTDFSFSVAFYQHRLYNNYTQSDILFLSSHTIGLRRVSDITAVFLHYKYVGDVYARTIEAVEKKNYYRSSQEYVRYLEKINSSPNKSFIDQQSIKYEEYESLQLADVFEFTEQYQNYINN